jgi:O-antigen/teichoic acid export membrane protein
MVADVMRQSFTVLGEAIILSLITVAKQQANAGDFKIAEGTLRVAFKACLAAAVFGAAFFIIFGDTVLPLVLKPDFVTPVCDLLPIFAVAFAFTTMRNFYFAQVIYFTSASYLELVISVLFLVVSATLSLVLVPAYGTHGAALALMTACIISCVGFMVIGRRWYRLPIDFTALAAMPALAALFVFVAHTMSWLIPGQVIPLAINALGFAVVGGFAVQHFGLLNTPIAVAESVAAR